jgi:hypothetical protein
MSDTSDSVVGVLAELIAAGVAAATAAKKNVLG